MLFISAQTQISLQTSSYRSRSYQEVQLSVISLETSMHNFLAIVEGFLCSECVTAYKAFNGDGGERSSFLYCDGA